MVEETSNPPFTPLDEMVIDDLETLRVLADPLRLSIVEYLSRPGTVKKIAEKLDKPPTKLYYHFNLLEQHQLITLVDTRIVSGIIEKHYQASARLYRLKPGLISPGTMGEGQELDLTLTSMFADVKNEIFESIRAGAIQFTDDIPVHRRLRFGQQHLYLTDSELKELKERLEALFAEYRHSPQDPASQDQLLYKLTMISFPSSRTINGADEK